MNGLKSKTSQFSFNAGESNRDKSSILWIRMSISSVCCWMISMLWSFFSVSSSFLRFSAKPPMTNKGVLRLCAIAFVISRRVSSCAVRLLKSFHEKISTVITTAIIVNATANTVINFHRQSSSKFISFTALKL